jgi:small subunit ribosomal protein S6
MTTEKTATATEAPKIEDRQFHSYELIYILNPQLEMEALDAAIAKINQFITGRGGVIASEDRWGKRKMAYAIKHFQEGTYVLTKFKMKPTFSQELESNLRIAEEVLRHLLVQVD